MESMSAQFPPRPRVQQPCAIHLRFRVKGNDPRRIVRKAEIKAADLLGIKACDLVLSAEFTEKMNKNDEVIWVGEFVVSHVYRAADYEVGEGL